MENNLGASEQGGSYMYYDQPKELADRNIFLENEIRKVYSELSVLRGNVRKSVSREDYDVVVEQNKVIAQNNEVLFSEKEELRKKVKEWEVKVISSQVNLEGMTTQVNELNKKRAAIQSQYLIVSRDKMKLEKMVFERDMKLEEEKEHYECELEKQKGLWKEQILKMNSRCVDLVQNNNNLLVKINHLEKQVAALKSEAEMECEAKRDTQTLVEFLDAKIKVLEEALTQLRDTHKGELDELFKKFIDAETQILNMKSGMRFSCNQVSQLTTENETLMQKLAELEQKCSKLKEEYNRKLEKQREASNGKSDEINQLKKKIRKLEKNEGKITEREVRWLLSVLSLVFNATLSVSSALCPTFFKNVIIIITQCTSIKICTLVSRFDGKIWLCGEYSNTGKLVHEDELYLGRHGCALSGYQRCISESVERSTDPRTPDLDRQPSK
ncbi:unnamed protein product [Orchesella dallaii]|uniref:Uncharacterized protein n=1 Tax=Orchesella dallaii TaxID=48710 RepID=A0ABP1RI07_9HEXA